MSTQTQYSVAFFSQAGEGFSKGFRLLYGLSFAVMYERLLTEYVDNGDLRTGKLSCFSKMDCMHILLSYVQIYQRGDFLLNYLHIY